MTSAIGIAFNETEKHHARRKHPGQDDDRGGTVNQVGCPPIVATAQLMIVLDASVVNIALPPAQQLCGSAYPRCRRPALANTTDPGTSYWTEIADRKSVV